jgi:hypothetical protein
VTVVVDLELAASAAAGDDNDDDVVWLRLRSSWMLSSFCITSSVPGWLRPHASTWLYPLILMLNSNRCWASAADSWFGVVGSFKIEIEEGGTFTQSEALIGTEVN